MATYLDLVTKLLAFTEKIPFSESTTEQQLLMLRHVNDGFRYVYNHGDLSFKTVVLRNFLWSENDPDSPSRGVPLPDNFMGFHQVGKVYIQDLPLRGPLEYLPYHRIMDYVEGQRSNARGIPTHYGLGGPSDGQSLLNQRELLLWPTPPESTLRLKLIYQATAPPDLESLTDDPPVEIPRIPATWHVPVILAMAKVFLKADKGADESVFSAALATAIKQMDIQEPHGREKPARRALSPFWRR